jgi:hypothetical protein
MMKFLLFTFFIFYFLFADAQKKSQSAISGSFSAQEAQDLAKILKSAKPDAPTKIISQHLVGKNLGKNTVSVPNLIIVTTDGLRWQEVFQGLDAEIAANEKFNQGDSLTLFKKYDGKNEAEKRSRLMPFLWSGADGNAMIFGNRNRNNKVNVENPYWFSYPGYSELLTGYADSAVNSNAYPPNPNSNLLAFLNKQPAYRNKVIAFGAWFAFDRILNEKASGFPVINAFDPLSSILHDDQSIELSKMLKDSYRPFRDEECLDVFTHYQALHYLKTRKPKAIYISYGETDEWAHAGKYSDYLNAAHQTDAWIREIWNWVQSTPGYRNNTYLLFTTDHGRGFHNAWTDHGIGIEGASSIWFALLGPKELKNKLNLNPGEQTLSDQYYQKQLAATLCGLLGLKFTADHPVAQPIQ